jgi:hypothetical protein
MCKQIKPETDFYLYTNKETGLKTEIPGFCKKCVRSYMDKFNQTEEGRAANKKRVAKHVDNNREDWNGYLRERFKQDKENMTDAYIRKALRGLKIKTEDITPEMIVEKRLQIQAKRHKKLITV